LRTNNEAQADESAIRVGLSACPVGDEVRFDGGHPPRPYQTETLASEARIAVEDYRAGVAPLVVPVTLFACLSKRHEIGYLQRQSYLRPYPKELMLHSHV
jgi:hypothetical protein